MVKTTKKQSENIYWLSGDRYFSITKKNDIINNLKKEKTWNVKDISNITDCNDFSRNLASRDLFDMDATIYIYDGKNLPDAEACYEIVKNIGEDKTLIIITPTVDGRTKFSKLFKDYLIEFEPVKDSRGFIDDKRMFTGMARTKGLSQWSGDVKLFDFIAESSEYDYGCIINEIYKLREYTLKEDKDITFEDYYEVGCIGRSKQTDLLESIKNRDKKEAFNSLYELLEDLPERSEWIEVCCLILETFDLFLFCKLLDPRGFGNEYKIGSEISQYWTKKGEKVGSGAIGFRYGKERDNIKKRDLTSINNSIKYLNKAIADLIYNKNKDHLNIMKSTLQEIL